MASLLKVVQSELDTGAFTDKSYVDKETAIRKGLTWTDGDKFGIAADAANKVEAGSLGRDSVRISSNKVWNNSVVVVDVLHMPEGCAVWPAFWTLGDGKEWPAAGEIDIIEGVGNDGNNQMTVHTANDAQCNLPADRAKKPGMEFWGKEHQNKCDGTAGCSILAPDTNSTFGPGLNNIGGGWYIMRRDTRGVAMWFYPRTDGDKVPDIVRNPTDDLDETALGQKIADFPSTPENKCDFNELLAAQRLIFNITFCGAWGGMKYAASACASNGKCADYVDNNPEAFKKAFWLVNSLRVYTPK